ncbi:MAG: S41 family peptidase [Barnesiella sp.]|nr:S41 family peptidase [Barnesiella sp.]
MKSNKSAAVWVPAIVAVAFAAGLFLGARFFQSGSEWNTRVKIGEIMDLITEEYVDEVNTDSILEVSIPDILAKLDPHTVYIPASELQATNEVLDGSFGGIGVVFSMQNDTATVMEVVSGGPAEKVGLLAGDRIVTVNDSVVAGIKIESENIRKKLKGPKGSAVKIGIKRSNSKDILSFEVVRGDIPVTAVDASYMIRPGIGYIRVNKFGRTTYMEFMNAMVGLRAAGAKRLILDLRGNTGGYMEPAILMANEFLGAGMPIVSTHGRAGNIESDFAGDGQGAFGDTELVVVIDEGSASASEIFAGAIQDNDRGLIVGRRSFGKGLVQRQIELPDSSAIRLTTARYYTPSGRCIQKPYTLGSSDDYELEIYTRFDNGEGFSADSAKIDTTKIFTTAGGRVVYGGGGIMPDVFVAGDTTGVSPYYIKVFNAGMLHRFAFFFTDTHRESLSKAESVEELLSLLPSDEIILNSFVEFARDKGNIPPRWYYINISRDLIVRQLKSLISSDVLGQAALFEVSNESDPAILRAIKELSDGNAVSPVSQ